MHDGDDRRQDGDQDEQPSVEVPRHPTGRVRIFGAEPAGEATAIIPAVPGGVVPVERPEEGAGSAVRLTGEAAAPSGADGEGQPVTPVRPGETAVPLGSDFSPADWLHITPDDEQTEMEPPPTELPHWTEAATGQVPAVLHRDTGDDQPSWGATAPSWREEHGDWETHEDPFEPSMYADEEAALGSLDETDHVDSDRRPWEFDLPSPALPAVDPSEPSLDATRQVPVVERPTGRPTEVEPPDRAGSVGRSNSDPGDADASFGQTGGWMPIESDVPGISQGTEGPQSADSEGDTGAPTGNARIGRVRRGGPRAGRVRAKRPEEFDANLEPPLAAAPPGASVTAVPGAGRRRGGLAGLAAADRSAEQASTESIDGPLPAEGRPTEATGPVAPDAGSSGRPLSRLARRGDRAVRQPSRALPLMPDPEGMLGGGPPTPRRPRPTEDAPPSQPASNMPMRIGTGIAAAVIGLLAFALGNVPSVVLVILVVTIAAGECFGVLRRAGYHPATLLGLVGTIALLIAVYAKGPAAIPLVLVLIGAFTLLWYLFGIERGSAVAGTAATMFTVGWVSLFGSFAALLVAPSSYPHREGIAFLLGAIIATVANDVGALLVGGWIGKRPLAPSVSPNKTWEGLLGGAVFAVVISALLVGQIHPWTLSKAALLGLVVAVVAPLGDLCESMLKRDFRIKDMGRFLPGHGGVLDRVDALLFVLPATYYLVRALHIG